MDFPHLGIRVLVLCAYEVVFVASEVIDWCFWEYIFVFGLINCRIMCSCYIKCEKCTFPDLCCYNAKNNDTIPA